jgi:hypothetical protein
VDQSLAQFSDERASVEVVSLTTRARGRLD